MAAYPFDFPSIRESIDIQDALLFGKPYGGLKERPIPCDTLQIEIPLTYQGREVVVMHSSAFMLGAVEMYACPIVPCMRRPSL